MKIFISYNFNENYMNSNFYHYVINELLIPNNFALYEKIKNDTFIIDFFNEFDVVGLMGFDYIDFVPIFKESSFVEKFTTNDLNDFKFEKYENFKSYTIIISLFDVDNDNMWDLIDEVDNYFKGKDYLLQVFVKESFPNIKRFRILLFK